MAKLDFREICEKSELEHFLLRFEDYVGVKLPDNYLAKSKVVGAFLHGRLVAGYMVVSEPPFRSLIFVPDKVKNLNPVLRGNTFEMMEINGLWISSSLRSPKLQLAVWFHLVANIFLSKKKYVLLMRNSRNRTMERLLGLAKPTLLYEGVPFLMAGDTTHERIQVSITSRWNILLFSYKYWLELRDRQRRAQDFKVRLGQFTEFESPKQSQPEPIK